MQCIVDLGLYSLCTLSLLPLPQSQPRPSGQHWEQQSWSSAIKGGQRDIMFINSNSPDSAAQFGPRALEAPSLMAANSSRPRHRQPNRAHPPEHWELDTTTRDTTRRALIVRLSTAPAPLPCVLPLHPRN